MAYHRVKRDNVARKCSIVNYCKMVEGKRRRRSIYNIICKRSSCPELIKVTQLLNKLNQCEKICGWRPWAGLIHSHNVDDATYPILLYWLAA